MDEYISNLDDDLSVNQKVEILDGPFAGFIGVVYSIDRVKHKVVVKVNFWGKDTPVEVSFYQVKPIDT
jgi:transcription termination/antitermination protein NusG